MSNRQQVIHGDCLDVLQTFASASFDAVIMDPPYTAAGGSTNGRTSSADQQYWRHWFSAVWRQIARVCTDDAFAFVFCDWRMVGAVSDCIRGRDDRQTASGWEVTQALVWDREHIGLGSPYRNAYEMIAFARGPHWKRDVFPRDIGTVVRHRWTYGTHKHHGAEKPVELIEWLMAPHSPSRVLDPFAGSGSVGVACANRDVSYVGIEIEESHVARALSRIAGDNTVFGASSC